MNLTHSLPASVLAFVTTMHLALVVLRSHRTPNAGTFSLVTLISLLFAASPWILPTVAGIAIGGTAHLAWFIACERLLPVAVMAGGARAAVLPAPAPPRAPGVTHLARRPREFVQAPVMAVFDEAAGVRTFRLARPEGFEFEAGQFLTVRVRAEGKDHVRCYSISSSPRAQGHLEITVKRQGLVSNALHAAVRPGSVLSVRAPAGSFTYPAGDDRPMVLIAGGVGITPLMSMLRHAVDAEPTRPITLYYSARSIEDVVFREEIDLLTRRHAQFRAFVAITGSALADGCFPGRISESLIRTTMPDIAHAICLLCGPTPMVEDLTAVLTSAGVERSQIRFEVFQAAVAASAGRPDTASDVPATQTGFDLVFKRSGTTARASARESVLEASESCGASIPSLCRAGVCGTCRTRVLSGDVDCRSLTLDDEDRQQGFVLACVAHAKSDCALDA